MYKVNECLQFGQPVSVSSLHIQSLKSLFPLAKAFIICPDLSDMNVTISLRVISNTLFTRTGSTSASQNQDRQAITS